MSSKNIHKFNVGDIVCLKRLHDPDMLLILAQLEVPHRYTYVMLNTGYTNLDGAINPFSYKKVV